MQVDGFKVCVCVCDQLDCQHNAKPKGPGGFIQKKCMLGRARLASVAKCSGGALGGAGGGVWQALLQPQLPRWVVT